MIIIGIKKQGTSIEISLMVLKRVEKNNPQQFPAWVTRIEKKKKRRKCSAPLRRSTVQYCTKAVSRHMILFIVKLMRLTVTKYASTEYSLLLCYFARITFCDGKVKTVFPNRPKKQVKPFTKK